MNAGVTASSRHGLSEDALFRKARGEFQLFSDDEADDFVEFAEKVMPRRFLELLQPDGRTAASSCSLDGIGSSNTQRLPHGTLPV